MKHSHSKAALDNRSRQLNDRDPVYHQSRGLPADQAAQKADAARTTNDATEPAPVEATTPVDPKR